MATFACFPPTTHHSITRISPSAALAQLSDYLLRSTIDVSLLPNAQLTESGPAVGSSSAQGGVVIHNLKRVEAGLKGEYLAAVVEEEEGFGALGGGAKELPTGDEDAQYGSNKKRKIADERALPLRQTQVGDDEDLIRTDPMESQQEAAAAADSRVNGWQDREDYEQSQAIEQGEIGPRNDVMANARVDSTQPPMIETTTEETSKEERRRRKRERRKEEQRAKEAKRKQMADEDRRRDLGEKERVAARMTVDGRDG